MPIVLGGLLVWNLATDWVWIGSSLNFLPSNFQKDLQNRARSIVDLINSAKSIIYAAQNQKRVLTAGEKTLIKSTCSAALSQVNDLGRIYQERFILYGRRDLALELTNTTTILLLEIRNARQIAGIETPTAVTQTKTEAKVTAVHDGDTCTLSNGEIIRLVGIDAPESTTTAGQASRKYLISLILGKSVKVESDPAHLKDIYGRRLGVIWVGATNINVEMLKAGYASYYEYEPNALVYKKVWQAAATEGKEISIKRPLTDLKEMRNYAFEKLRLWKSEERAAQKAATDEAKERYKSEQYEQIEELKDNYAITQETLKATHSANADAITALYKAKTITIEERARRRAAENTLYLEAKAEASAIYREETSKIKDPYKEQKSELTKKLQAAYRDINNIYTAKRKEITLEYNANVKAIKDRVDLPFATEPELPPTITLAAAAAEPTSVAAQAVPVPVEAPKPPSVAKATFGPDKIELLVNFITIPGLGTIKSDEARAKGYDLTGKTEIPTVQVVSDPEFFKLSAADQNLLWDYWKEQPGHSIWGGAGGPATESLKLRSDLWRFYKP